VPTWLSRLIDGETCSAAWTSSTSHCRPSRTRPPPYPAIEHAVGLILTQAIQHGEEHRGHVSSILGAHGVEVPELSGWEYFRQLVLGGV